MMALRLLAAEHPRGLAVRHVVLRNQSLRRQDVFDKTMGCSLVSKIEGRGCNDQAPMTDHAPPAPQRGLGRANGG